jgi:nitronate monooxygenase
MLAPLHIGDLHIDIPIIQGGMGVRVSGSQLVSAVSNEGALGVIASVGTGEEDCSSADYTARSRDGLRALIHETQALTDRPIGVNVMCALTNYESLIQVCVEENVAAIISGAGLPIKLPAMVGDSPVKLIPIVSSGRAADLICRTWKKRYDRQPDAFVVEGHMAGGHLGTPIPEDGSEPAGGLDALVTIVRDVIEVANRYEEVAGRPIPVIAAGGVFDGADIARMIKLGASGVQMGTRFVCTHECDASDAYKQTYLDSTEEDILLIRSPVGLPLRVVRNDFVDTVSQGVRVPFDCRYHCLITCKPKETNYCIAQALLNAYRGEMDRGFVTCGSNAYRIDKLVSVHELLTELVTDAAACLDAEATA